MTRHCLRWTICGSLLSFLLAGCATERSKIAPSLLSELKKDKPKVQRVNYQVGEDEFASKDVDDPLNLKLHYARWMEQLQNYPDARTHYNAVLADRPENVEAIIGLARVEQAARQLDEAEAGFRRALALRPDSPLAQHAYGQFQLSQGRITEALPLLNKALVAQPNNDAYRYHVAVALAKSGDVNAALPHFKRTVGEAAAHNNIGTILRDKGDLAGAEQHFRQALTIDPELPQSRRALATLYNQRESQQRLADRSQNGSVIQRGPNSAATQTVTPAHHQQRPTQQRPAR